MRSCKSKDSHYNVQKEERTNTKKTQRLSNTNLTKNVGKLR